MSRATLAVLASVLLFVGILPALSAQTWVARPAQPAQAPPTPVQQFQKLEDTWSIAMANKDQFGLENLLSPTFIDISASGSIRTRNQSIADVIGGLPEPLVSVEQKVVNVREIGDVAVVEGTYMLRLHEDQKMRDERGIFTHVYQKGRSGWDCVSAQRTAVVDELESKNKKSAATAAATSPEKKSDAAEPFHIPLLYKGKPSTTAATPGPTPAQN